MVRIGFRAYLANWRETDASFARKSGMVVRNSLRRLNLRPCCGHPGEPGC